MTTSPAGANADTPAMVASRQRVLDAGLFSDLDLRLAESLADCGNIVEVGAGTGHHLAQVLEAHANAHGLATDVSSAAIRKAARVHPRMAAVVADTWAGLPIRTECMDAVLCVFAPRNRDEFARILRPDGRLVVVTPLPDHLHQLREMTGMIGIQPHKHDELVAGLESRFEIAGHEEVRTVVDLDGPTASDAVAMGPSAHHVRDVHVDGVEVTSAVEITTLIPRSSRSV
ncbi:methyltransferase domain-containing protein [Cutibacterium equinum]|uniref:Methyltransferase domain-containing protein n=2 Tax=Cutibacterium equinum TaxID=3016342 RepID=A0ABY7R2H1_9ACTN|nr:methyltransferase domain-containing protein [Cutibacterium equinum]WCC81124.1 methyltransferase domain-containing protein [Cutibacterium equinum]